MTQRLDCCNILVLKKKLKQELINPKMKGSCVVFQYKKLKLTKKLLKWLAYEGWWAKYILEYLC